MQRCRGEGAETRGRGCRGACARCRGVGEGAEARSARARVAEGAEGPRVRRRRMKIFLGIGNY